MIYKMFYYSPFLYVRITAADGEESASVSNDESFGVVRIKGGVQVIESTIPEQVGLICDKQNCFIPKWPGAQRFRVIGDSEWCCFNHNGTGERTFVYQEITDSFILPAHTGFVVISGSVVADGLTANQDDYFRPRTEPCTVIGNAKVVLVS